MKNTRLFFLLILICFIPNTDAIASPISYTINKEDNLDKISKTYSTSINSILEINKNIKDKNTIYKDSTIFIPYSKSLELINLINEERNKEKLNPLIFNKHLSYICYLKSYDMHKNKYFSHLSNTYGEPKDMLNEFLLTPSYVGENLSIGILDPKKVLTSFLDSPLHKENIFNPHFTHIGVGIFINKYEIPYYTVIFTSNP